MAERSTLQRRLHKSHVTATVCKIASSCQHKMRRANTAKDKPATPMNPEQAAEQAPARSSIATRAGRKVEQSFQNAPQNAQLAVTTRTRKAQWDQAAVR